VTEDIEKTFSLAGKHALVTGGSSGIGAAIALALTKAGATVAICARGKERLDQVLSACREHAPGSVAFVCDLSREQAIAPLIQEVLEALGHLDILVNNAGIPKRRKAYSVSMKDVREVMEVNFFAPVALTLGLLEHLTTRPQARIVNISSIAAKLSSPGECGYDASKAALSAFSESASIDLHETQVRFLTVYPGLVETELIADKPDNEPHVRGVETISPEEVAASMLQALTDGIPEVYVPAWFKDVVLAKDQDLVSYLSGAAEFVKTQY
jgi:NAD(P)-dependent dehydrogenase (short-subunit alcohol dehydrogenase family)